MTAENPFKKALETTGRDLRPFSREEANPVKKSQLRTISDMNLVDRETLSRMPKVAGLTVRDLNDLASEFSGIPTNNPVVKELSLEDIQDMEGVFYEFKLAAGKELAARGGVEQLTSVDVSCCCCTPCSCCAATDMTETA